MGMGNNPISSVDPDGGWVKGAGFFKNLFNSDNKINAMNAAGSNGSYFRDPSGGWTANFIDTEGFNIMNFDNGGSIINFGFLINGNGGWEPKTHANHVGDKSIDMTYSNAPFEVLKAGLDFVMDSAPENIANGVVSGFEAFVVSDSISQLDSINSREQSGKGPFKFTVIFRRIHKKTREGRPITEEQFKNMTY